MTERYQTTIRCVLSIMGVIAVWSTLFITRPGIACILIGLAILVAVCFVKESPMPLFWAPVVVSTNCSLATVLAIGVVPAEPVFMAVLAFSFVVSVSLHAIHRTRHRYCGAQDRSGVIWVGLFESGIGGLFAGAMLSVPIVVSLILTFAGGLPGIADYESVWFAFTLTLGGMLVGLALGIVLGLVCDIVVGIDARLLAQKKRMDHYYASLENPPKA